MQKPNYLRAKIRLFLLMMAIIFSANSAFAQTNKSKGTAKSEHSLCSYKKAEVDSAYKALLPKITFKNKALHSQMDFVKLYGKFSTRIALFQIASEKFFGENTVLIPLNHKKEDNHWKIEAGLSYFTGNSIIDAKTLVCMNSHKIWLCPAKTQQP